MQSYRYRKVRMCMKEQLQGGGGAENIPTNGVPLIVLPIDDALICLEQQFQLIVRYRLISCHHFWQGVL